MRRRFSPDAGGLDGQNLVHAAAVKPAQKLPANLLKKGNIHLVVQKTVHLQHIVALYRTVPPDAFLEQLPTGRNRTFPVSKTPFFCSGHMGIPPFSYVSSRGMRLYGYSLP